MTDRKALADRIDKSPVISVIEPCYEGQSFPAVANPLSDKDKSLIVSLLRSAPTSAVSTGGEPVASERNQIAKILAKCLWSGASFDDGTQSEKFAFLRAADAVLAALPAAKAAGDTVDQPQGCCMGMAPSIECECFMLAGDAEGDAQVAADDAWQELIHKDDRTSPEEYPEMALITSEELAGFMRRAKPSGDVRAAVIEECAKVAEAVQYRMRDECDFGAGMAAREIRALALSRPDRQSPTSAPDASTPVQRPGE